MTALAPRLKMFESVRWLLLILGCGGGRIVLRAEAGGGEAGGPQPGQAQGGRQRQEPEAAGRPSPRQRRRRCTLLVQRIELRKKSDGVRAGPREV